MLWVRVAPYHNVWCCSHSRCTDVAPNRSSCSHHCTLECSLQSRHSLHPWWLSLKGRRCQKVRTRLCYYIIATNCKEWGNYLWLQKTILLKFLEMCKFAIKHAILRSISLWSNLLLLSWLCNKINFLAPKFESKSVIVVFFIRLCIPIGN